MFGDSYTEGGKWNSLIHKHSVLRFGWCGFTSEQLSRIIGRVVDYKPHFVFILCGNNDIGSRCFNIDNVITNYKIIADTLENHNITPVFQKLLYQHNRPDFNIIIDSINQRLLEFCNNEHIEFINITEGMMDSTGLKVSLTKDWVHLNNNGYKIWADKLNEYLKNKK